MRSCLSVAVLFAFVSAQLIAQQGDGPRFDVVSVKPNNSPEPGGRNALEPGGYEGINVTVRRLIALAYMPLPFSLIDGGPSWIGTDRFDVRAKFAGNPPREQLQRMMRNLLADRFRLRTHMETRPTQIYALMVERAGVLGPSLQPAKVDCANPAADRQPNVPWCAFQYTEGLLRGRGVTLDQIAGDGTQPHRVGSAVGQVPPKPKAIGGGPVNTHTSLITIRQLL